MRGAAFIATLGLAAAYAAPAPAQPADDELRERARADSDRGRRYYELGEFTRAIAAYRSAYLILPNPGVLFDLGQAYRMNGDCARAAVAYRGFLRSETGGPVHDLAGRQLIGVEACARKTETAAQERARRLRKGGVVSMAVGGTALAAAAYFAIDADRTSGGSVDSKKDSPPIDDTAARHRRATSFAIGLGVAGGLAVTTGAVLFVLGRHHAPGGAELWMAPSPDAPTAGATWHF